MLIRFLLACYPSLWRQRYGEEMQALLEETKITPKTVIDMLLGAFEAWTDPSFHDQSYSAKNIRLDYHWLFWLSSFIVIALVATNTSLSFPMNDTTDQDWPDIMRHAIDIPMFLIGGIYLVINVCLSVITPLLWWKLRKRERFVGLSLLMSLGVTFAEVCFISNTQQYIPFYHTFIYTLCTLVPSLTLLNMYLIQQCWTRRFKQAISVILMQLGVVVLPYIIIQILLSIGLQSGMVSIAIHPNNFSAYLGRSAFFISIPFILMVLFIYRGKEWKGQRLLNWLMKCSGIFFYAFLVYTVVLDLLFRSYQYLILPLKLHWEFSPSIYQFLWYSLGLSLVFLIILIVIARTQWQRRHYLALEMEKTSRTSVEKEMVLEQHQQS